MTLEKTLSFESFSPSIQNSISFLDDHIQTLWLVELYNIREYGYHNLNHIDELLQTLTEHQNAIRDDDPYKLNDYDLFALVLAIVFHDVIYVAGKNDNENKSAQLARQELDKAWVDEIQTQIVSDIIEDSADHTPRFGDYEQGERRHYLGQIMFDLDFTPLGKNYIEFRNDGSRICNEYVARDNANKLTVVEFYKGRVQFLREMLNKERIFNLDYFYNRFEGTVRSNMENEIKDIEQALY